MSISSPSAGKVELIGITGIHVSDSQCERCQGLESRLNQELLKRDVARSCISHYRQAIAQLQHKLKQRTEEYESILVRLDELKGVVDTRENRRHSEMPVSSTAAPAKLSADGTSRDFAKATPESLQHGQSSEAQSDRGEVPQETSIAPAATQTSPRGHPKGVQTDRSVAAFAQGLAHEVAVEVGEFLGEKEADSGIAVDREASPSKPDKRFCTACGRRATIGVPKNTQTELSEDDPEDGVLWPKLSAYLYKGPTKHLAMNMSTQTEYTAAGAFHDLFHDVGQIIMQTKEEESETSGEEYALDDSKSSIGIISSRKRTLNRGLPAASSSDSRSPVERRHESSAQNHGENDAEIDDDWEISDDEVDDADDTMSPSKRPSKKSESARTVSTKGSSSTGSEWSRRWLGSLTSRLSSTAALGSGQDHSS